MDKNFQLLKIIDITTSESICEIETIIVQFTKILFTF